MGIAGLVQGPGWCPMCPMVGGGWWWALNWLVAVAVVVAVVWLLYRVARGRGWLGEGEEPSPEEIVRRRYARGEIDRETYERMLEDPRRGRPA